MRTNNFGIVHTSVGRTDVFTGEIVDLTGLKRKPRRTARRAVTKRRRQSHGLINHWSFVAMVSTLGLWISLT